MGELRAYWRSWGIEGSTSRMPRWLSRHAFSRICLATIRAICTLRTTATSTRCICTRRRTETRRQRVSWLGQRASSPPAHDDEPRHHPARGRKENHRYPTTPSRRRCDDGIYCRRPRIGDCPVRRPCRSPPRSRPPGRDRRRRRSPAASAAPSGRPEPPDADGDSHRRGDQRGLDRHRDAARRRGHHR